MDIQETLQEDVVVLTLSGKVDTAGTRDLEHKLMQLFDSGVRRFVVDCSRVTAVKGAGLRLLLAFNNRLEGNGAFVLCSLNENLKSVLEVSNLLQSFNVTPSVAGAVAKARASRRISAVTSAVEQVLRAESSDPLAGSSGEPSRLAGVVSRTLR